MAVEERSPELVRGDVEGGGGFRVLKILGLQSESGTTTDSSDYFEVQAVNLG